MNIRHNENTSNFNDSELPNTLRIKSSLEKGKLHVYCIRCGIEAEMYKSNLVSPRVYYRCCCTPKADSLFARFVKELFPDSLVVKTYPVKYNHTIKPVHRTVDFTITINNKSFFVEVLDAGHLRSKKYLADQINIRHLLNMHPDTNYILFDASYYDVNKEDQIKSELENAIIRNKRISLVYDISGKFSKIFKEIMALYN